MVKHVIELNDEEYENLCEFLRAAECDLIDESYMNTNDHRLKKFFITVTGNEPKNCYSL